MIELWQVDGFWKVSELRHWRKTGKILLVLVVWALVPNLVTSFALQRLSQAQWKGKHLILMLFCL